LAGSTNETIVARPRVLFMAALRFDVTISRIVWLCLAAGPAFPRAAWCAPPQTQPAAGEADPLQIDLSLALHEELVAWMFEDEGVVLAAGLGKRILTLPFPLEPFARLERETSLGATAFKLEAADGQRAKLLGYRVGYHDGAEPDQLAQYGETLFERIGVRRDSSGEFRFRPGNSERPKGKRTGQRPAPRDEFGADAWGALVIEIDSGISELRVGLRKTGLESIDVAYLADSAEPLVVAEASALKEGPLARTIALAQQPSGAMAALALERLAALPEQLDEKTRSSVRDAVWMALAEGLGHADRRAARAAWTAFSSRTSLGASGLAALARAGAAAHRTIVHHAADDLRSAGGQARANVLIALNLAWRGGDASVCAAVADTVIADGAIEAYDVFDGATPAGVDQLFARARAATSREVRGHLIRSLLGQVLIEREPELLATARELGIELTEPRDPIFRRFEAAGDTRMRMAILRALEVVPATAILHTTEFADFVEAATAERMDAAVRETAFGMVIAQAARARPVAATAFGEFPLTGQRGIVDGLSVGLARAAIKGSPQRQVEAFDALLRRGESAAAAEALRDSRLPPDALAAMLAKLAAREDLMRTDGAFAFLCAAACGLGRGGNAVAFRHLDQASHAYARAVGWRMRLAARCGLNWDDLLGLTRDRDPQVSAPALRWLGAVAHLSEAEIGAIGSAKGNRERAGLLAQFNAKKSNAAAARYGCLLVIETVATLDPIRVGASATPRWSAPRRATLFGPIVQGSTASDEWVLSVAGGEIGRGRPRRTPAAIPEKKLWPPALAPAHWAIVGVGRDRLGEPAEFHPLALPGSAVLPAGAEGALNVDAVSLIREGAANAGDESLGLSRSLPERFVVTLRPVGFGTLAGTGELQKPVDAARDLVLLNVLVILEPLG